MRTLILLLALTLSAAGCSSKLEFQQPDAGPAVVGEQQQSFQVRNSDATKGGGKAGKARRADNGGKTSKIRRADNGGKTSKVRKADQGGKTSISRADNGGSMSKAGSASLVTNEEYWGTITRWDAVKGMGLVKIDPTGEVVTVFGNSFTMASDKQSARVGQLLRFRLVQGSNGGPFYVWDARAYS